MYMFIYQVFTNFFNKLTNGTQKSVRRLWDIVKKKRLYRNINNLNEVHHNLIGDLASFPTHFSHGTKNQKDFKINFFFRGLLIDFPLMGHFLESLESKFLLIIIYLRESYCIIVSRCKNVKLYIFLPTSIFLLSIQKKTHCSICKMQPPSQPKQPRKNLLGLAGHPAYNFTTILFLDRELFPC